jgi:hypothetical protein
MIIDKALYLKFYLIRAQGHVGYILQTALITVSAATYFKLSNINGWYTIPLFAIILGAQLAIGWLDVRYGIVQRETSLFNKYNPEIQELLRRKKTE